jgi:hypothetical protein
MAQDKAAPGRSSCARYPLVTCVPDNTLLLCSRVAAALLAGRALRSADALAAQLYPQGHLRHMPSHLYVRTGRYADAVLANGQALDVDIQLSRRCLQPYFPEHNIDMLLYAASMGGMLRTAETHARQVTRLSELVLDEYMSSGSYWVPLPLLYTRYGLWDKVMSIPQPVQGDRGGSSTGGLEFATFAWQYARFMAMASPRSCPSCWSAAAINLLQAAGDDALDGDGHATSAAAAMQYSYYDVQQQLEVLMQAAVHIKGDVATLPGPAPGLYSAAYRMQTDVMLLAAHAKQALMIGNASGAVMLLQQAVDLEDADGYIEPPRFAAPSRQCLCWASRIAGDGARSVRECVLDLQQYPNNIWSLTGLRETCNLHHGVWAGKPAEVLPAAESGDIISECGLAMWLDHTFAPEASSWEQMCTCLSESTAVAAAAAQAEILMHDSCLHLA